MSKLRVGILRWNRHGRSAFYYIVDNHPWFEVTTIAASPRSEG